MSWRSWTLFLCLPGVWSCCACYLGGTTAVISWQCHGRQLLGMSLCVCLVSCSFTPLIPLSFKGCVCVACTIHADVIVPHGSPFPSLTQGATLWRRRGMHSKRGPRPWWWQTTLRWGCHWLGGMPQPLGHLLPGCHLRSSCLCSTSTVRTAAHVIHLEPDRITVLADANDCAAHPGSQACARPPHTRSRCPAHVLHMGVGHHLL